MAGPTTPEPVTVVEERTLVPGQEGDYQAWVHRVLGASERCPGNRGITGKRQNSESVVVAGRTVGYPSPFKYVTIWSLRVWAGGGSVLLASCKADQPHHASYQVNPSQPADY